MKVAIPVDEQSLNANVSLYCGRAPHFLFYNTVSKEYYFLDNRTVASRRGAGQRVAEVIADHGVKVLLAKSCGKSVEEALRKTEVLIYSAIPGSAKENLDVLARENLPLMREFHEEFHGKKEKTEA
jgi:predicted Fe-Mo cluster-binding NifX family protein